jgi:hypothetical protein
VTGKGALRTEGKRLKMLGRGRMGRERTGRRWRRR